MIDPDRRTWLAGLSCLALTFLIAACAPDTDAGSDEPWQRVINVEVLSLQPESFTERIRMTGTVQANRDVRIAAEESGVVRELPVERGAQVREGDPLVRIDDRILGAQLREAEARADLARETWERRKRLWEEDGVGSELAYLEARYGWEQADAARENLAERLNRAVIRAPVSGILEERTVEVGSNLTPGTVVGRIVQVNPVKISAGVPERYSGDVTPGTVAQITFDALDGTSHTASITYVGSTVDPGNRTFEVEMLLPNPDRRFKPEMVANVEVSRQVLNEVIVIPQDAMVRTGEGFVAFVAVEGSEGTVAEVRPLVTGPAQRNRVVIREGLAPGDRLIVVGHKLVAHGDRVRITGAGS